jgi:CBS domain-containing protein
MTTRVVAVTPDTTFKELATTLIRERISAVPVVDDTGHPIGVVSEADIVAKQEFHGGNDETPHGDRAGRDRWFRAKAQTAAELMTTPVRAVRADEPLSAAARILAAAHVRRLFVTGLDGRLVGVVSRRDLLRVYDQTEEDLREQVEDMVEEVGVAPGAVDVRAADGVVTLDGLVERRSLVDMIVRLVGALPGVVGVRNNLRHGVDDVVVAAWTGFSP